MTKKVDLARVRFCLFPAHQEGHTDPILFEPFDLVEVWERGILRGVMRECGVCGGLFEKRIAPGFRP